jgi:hypothetical protein
MVMISLARSPPGQDLLPAPKGMKADALVFIFYYKRENDLIISRNI